MYGGGSEDSLMNDLFVLELKTMTFTHYPTTFEKCYYAASGIVNDKLYIMGGFFTGAMRKAVTEIIVFNTSMHIIIVFDNLVSRMWEPPVPIYSDLLTIHEGVSEHCAYTIGNTILYTCGRSDDDVQSFFMTFQPNAVNPWCETYYHVNAAHHHARAGHTMEYLGQGTLVCMSGIPELSANEDDTEFVQTPFVSGCDLLLDFPLVYDQYLNLYKHRPLTDIVIIL